MWRSIEATIALVIALSFPCHLAAKPPTLTHFSPYGVKRGETATIKAAGNFDHWPPAVHLDGAGVKIEPAKDKATFTVTAEKDAAPGLRWVRFTDEEGATALRPLFVSTLDEVLEDDNDADNAQTVKPSVIVNGVLSKRGDVDVFAVELKKGQNLIASLQANRLLNSPMDGILQIVSADGFVLTANDDEIGLDPMIVFPAPMAARYLVRVFAFPATPNSTIGFAGGSGYVYRLTLTTGPIVDQATPISANQVRLRGWNIPDALKTLPYTFNPSGATTIGHADLGNALRLKLPTDIVMAKPREADPQPIAVPSMACGVITEPGEADRFTFPAKTKQTIRFRIESESLGYTLDSVLTVCDSSGKTLKRSDDKSRSDKDASLDFQAPSDGAYIVSVTDLYGTGGFRHAYQLIAEIPKPDFSLTVAKDRFIVVPGKPTEVTVNIERHDGFAHPIQITGKDLPKETHLEPAAVDAKTKSVKVKLTGKVPVNQGFEIVGVSTEEPKISRTAAATIDGLAETTSQLWITVTKPENKSDKK